MVALQVDDSSRCLYLFQMCSCQVMNDSDGVSRLNVLATDDDDTDDDDDDDDDARLDLYSLM